MLTRILIIIPCYNEEASIPMLLNEVQNLVLPENYYLEIAIVNDCSKDKTAKIAKCHKVTVLDLPVNLGIGGAMQTGYLYAFRNEFDLAVQMDGDGQHPPGELHKLIKHYDATKANVVIGSRFLDKEGFQSSFIRRTGIRYFHWLNRFFTGKSIYDSTSGFRMFDKKAIAMAADYYPDEYPEPESLVIFAKAGLEIKEVAVIMRERQGGKSSIRNFSTLYYCIKVTISMFYSYIKNI